MQQHDGAVEVGIVQRRCRDEQTRGQHGHPPKGRTRPAVRRALTRKGLKLLNLSSRGRRRSLPLMSLKNLLTVKEVAALLRVSTQTLYKMLEQGQIPAVKVGSQWRFDGDKIQTWIERQGARASGGS